MGPSVPSHHLSNLLPENVGFCARFRGLHEGWSWQVSGQSLQVRSWFTLLPWLASGYELKWREGSWQNVVWGTGFLSDLGQLIVQPANSTGEKKSNDSECALMVGSGDFSFVLFHF